MEQDEIDRLGKMIHMAAQGRSEDKQERCQHSKLTWDLTFSKGFCVKCGARIVLRDLSEEAARPSVAQPDNAARYREALSLIALTKIGGSPVYTAEWMCRLADEVLAGIDDTMHGESAPSHARQQQEGLVHTDHPSRHWDRTCPACVAETAGDDPARDLLAANTPVVSSTGASGHGLTYSDGFTTGLAAAQSATGQQEGFYEKLWKDFVSLQRGEAQAMVKDAARYRWLRDEASWLGFQWRDAALSPPPTKERSFNNQSKPADIDAAIDAAMRGTMDGGTKA